MVESRHPVVHVSWKEALKYCSRLDRALRRSDDIPHTLKRLFENGFRLSLPSEAEWEKAARGTDGRIYPWGDSIDPSRANFDATKPVTTTVDAFPKGVSPYGIFDMSGNVHEWTRSNLKSYPYVSDDDRERPDDNGLRVLRGGSFKDNANSLRAAYRDAGPIGYRCNYIGFRVSVLPSSSLNVVRRNLASTFAIAEGERRSDQIIPLAEGGASLGRQTIGHRRVRATAQEPHTLEVHVIEVSAS